MSGFRSFLARWIGGASSSAASAPVPLIGARFRQQQIAFTGPDAHDISFTGSQKQSIAFTGPVAQDITQ